VCMCVCACGGGGSTHAERWEMMPTGNFFMLFFILLLNEGNREVISKSMMYIILESAI
jgi:hypothetical protein